MISLPATFFSDASFLDFLRLGRASEDRTDTFMVSQESTRLLVERRRRIGRKREASRELLFLHET